MLLCRALFAVILFFEQPLHPPCPPFRLARVENKSPHTVLEYARLCWLVRMHVLLPVESVGWWLHDAQLQVANHVAASTAW